MASTDPPEKPFINIFEAAKARQSADITVMWTPKDVQAIRPDWNPCECEEFLRRVADQFAPGVLRVGMTLLQALSIDPRFGGKIGQRPRAAGHEGEESPDF